jgi:hypothetical protein
MRHAFVFNLSIMLVICRARYTQAGMELQRDHSTFELKESAKKEVLWLWTATENIIMGELSRHFVEKDVDDLEDDPSQNPDEGPPSLSRRSSGNFFGLNFQQADMDGLNAEDKLTVCPPSCRLAAPVYKDIMSFSAKVKALLCEEIGSNIVVESIVEKSVQRYVSLLLCEILCFLLG